MKQNITNKLNQCKHCFSYYIENIEGENGFCDLCSEFSDAVVDNVDKSELGQGVNDANSVE
jgi:hypothetical protein